MNNFEYKMACSAPEQEHIGSYWLHASGYITARCQLSEDLKREECCVSVKTSLISGL